MLTGQERTRDKKWYQRVNEVTETITFSVFLSRWHLSFSCSGLFTARSQALNHQSEVRKCHDSLTGSVHDVSLCALTGMIPANVSQLQGTALLLFWPCRNQLDLGNCKEKMSPWYLHKEKAGIWCILNTIHHTDRFYKLENEYQPSLTHPSTHSSLATLVWIGANWSLL